MSDNITQDLADRIDGVILSARLLYSIHRLTDNEVADLDVTLRGWRSEPVSHIDLGLALDSDDDFVAEVLEIWWNEADPAPLSPLEEVRAKWNAGPARS